MVSHVHGFGGLRNAPAGFARRFDESLLVELDLVGLADDRAIKATGQYYDRCEQNPFAEGCVAD